MNLKTLLLVTLVLGLAAGQELLINGDFEQELTVGWAQAESGVGTHTINRDTSYHPDPDYEAYTYQYDNPGWARLSQAVSVPGVNLLLSFWGSFEEVGGSSSCWPAACICVNYLDAGNAVLGETRYFYSTYANWVPSPTLSLIRITDPAWNQYTLNIVEELSQNLPGVNPADVAKVEVVVLAYTYSG
jgi:hypothetical protein